MRANKLPAHRLAPEELAVAVNLRYVSDDDIGYSRRRNGKGFVYFDHRERPLNDDAKIARFEGLSIPPAWRHVWICRYASGHLQATGRDSRRRKQYLYHPRWSEIANLAKFWRLGAFGAALPSLRREVARILRGRKLTAERVVAGMVGLLDATSIRIGNEEYARENGSYGLATLRDRHVKVARHAVELQFVGKSGMKSSVAIKDKSLVRLIKQVRAVPGRQLFRYGDQGRRRRSVTAADVNEFLSERLGEDFTAKDFRTWKASALVAGRLYEQREIQTARQRRRVIKQVVDEAADLLGNTPVVCRKYYVHPGLLESFDDGSFERYFRRFRPRATPDFGREERILQRFLNRWKPQG